MTYDEDCIVIHHLAESIQNAVFFNCLRADRSISQQGSLSQEINPHFGVLMLQKLIVDVINYDSFHIKINEEVPDCSVVSGLCQVEIFPSDCLE